MSRIFPARHTTVGGIGSLKPAPDRGMSREAIGASYALTSKPTLTH